MSTVVVRRPPRRAAPKIENGEFPMQEPPGLPEAQAGQLSQLLMYLPMGASSAMMMLVFIQPGQNRLLMYVASAMMAVSMVAMGLVSLTQAAGQRKQRLKGERRDYLRYLGQVRKVVRKAVDQQRESVLFTHPDPDKLWALALLGSDGKIERLWERRAAHPDFAEVRLGLGEQRLALKLTPPQTKPVEDLEPLCASALRRFLKAYSTVNDVPMAVYLRGFARVSLGQGDERAGRALVRALVAHLAVFHTPDDLRIAVCAASDRLADWDWMKWLPHAAHPVETDAAGPARLISDDWADLEALLDTVGGADARPLGERARFEAGAEPSAEEPFVVVVVDGGHVSANARLAGQGYRNLVALDVTGVLGWTGEKQALRLRVTPDLIETVSRDRRGNDKPRPLGRPDALSDREQLGERRIAQLRERLVQAAGAVPAARDRLTVPTAPPAYGTAAPQLTGPELVDLANTLREVEAVYDTWIEALEAIEEPAGINPVAPAAVRGQFGDLPDVDLDIDAQLVQPPTVVGIPNGLDPYVVTASGATDEVHAQSADANGPFGPGSTVLVPPERLAELIQADPEYQRRLAQLVADLEAEVIGAPTRLEIVLAVPDLGRENPGVPITERYGQRLADLLDANVRVPRAEHAMVELSDQITDDRGAGLHYTIYRPDPPDWRQFGRPNEPRRFVSLSNRLQNANPDYLAPPQPREDGSNPHRFTLPVYPDGRIGLRLRSGMRPVFSRQIAEFIHARVGDGAYEMELVPAGREVIAPDRRDAILAMIRRRVDNLVNPGGRADDSDDGGDGGDGGGDDDRGGGPGDLPPPYDGLVRAEENPDGLRELWREQRGVRGERGTAPADITAELDQPDRGLRRGQRSACAHA